MSDTSKRVPLVATITVRYYADPQYYPSSDPHEMAKVDQDNAYRETGPADIIAWANDDDDITVEIRPA